MSMHPLRRSQGWSLGLLLFAWIGVSGCQTTRLRDVSRSANGSFAPASKILVVVETRTGSLRESLEEALAVALRQRGMAVDGSLGRLDLGYFAADPVREARAWSSRTGQALLVVRPLDGENRLENKDRRGHYSTGSSLLPTPVIQPRDKTMRDTMAAHAFATAASTPSVVPSYAMVEDRQVFEIAFLDTATGEAVWNALTETKVREGGDGVRWMSDWARVVVRQLRKEKLVP